MPSSKRRLSQTVRENIKPNQIFRLQDINHEDFMFKTLDANKRVYDLSEAPDIKCSGFLNINKSDLPLTKDQIIEGFDKEYCILVGSILYVLQGIGEYQIKKSLNVEFCKMEVLNTMTKKNSQLLGLRLVKKQKSLIFLTESEKDLAQWKSALMPYVIQSKIQKNFYFTTKLGQGTYGQVFLGDNLENANQPVAIKVLIKSKINESANGLTNLLNEIKVHWALEKCANMLRLLEIYEDENSIYLVLEYQAKGSLMNTIIENTQFTENQVRMIMEQLLLALDFFHQKKIIHRDIKLENILINQIEDDHYDLRVADFGLSVFTFDNESVFHKCGTPGYVAPEVLGGKGYSYKSDIFSLGSVFFNLLTGRYLFSGDGNQDVLTKNYYCKIDHIHQYLNNISVTGKDLLFLMLRANPDDRPTAKEALMHQWFKCDIEIIQDLLIVNQLMCNDKMVQSERSIKENINSFSSFKIASCYFKETIQKNESFKKKRSGAAIVRNTLGIPNLQRGSSNFSVSSDGNNSMGSFQRISYYNVLRESSRSKSSDQSFKFKDELSLKQSLEPKSREKSHFYNKQKSSVKRPKKSSQSISNSFSNEEKKFNKNNSLKGLEEIQLELEKEEEKVIQVEKVHEDYFMRSMSSHRLDLKLQMTTRKTEFLLNETKVIPLSMKMSLKNRTQSRRILL